jgi:hypothetical protein
MTRPWQAALGMAAVAALGMTAGPVARETDGVAAVQVQAVTGSFSRTLTVTGVVDLDVTTGSGGITVQPGAAGRVLINGTIRARDRWFGSGLSAEERVRRLEATPPIEQQGNTIRVGRIEDEELRQNVSITYELVVPAQTRLRSSTGSGSHTIGDLAGPVESSSGSGRIRIGRIGSSVKASTGSGGIEIEASRGEVTATTGSGSIRLLSVAGPVRARTGSGHIEIEQTAAGDLDVSAASGGIEIRGARGAAQVRTASGHLTIEGSPTGDWRLSSSSGGIDLTLPADAAFALDASTSSGRIDTTHPVTVTGSLGRRQLRGSVRGGGTLVHVRTASGSIRIR